MRAPILTFKRARRLRQDMSLPEIILWRILRNGRLEGFRFRRQHPIGPYILDFYCASARLAIEIDGESHDHAQQVAKDLARDRWLAGQDIRVLRFAAADILKDDRLTGVFDAIMAAVAERAAAPSVGFADSSPVNGGAPKPVSAAGVPE